MTRPWSSCVPCEKFRRATFIPASIKDRSSSSEDDAGPIVHTIFVRRLAAAVDIQREVSEEDVRLFLVHIESEVAESS